MVYGFAKQSGGQVRIQSKPGAGTSVTIYLPATDTEPARDLQPARAEIDGGDGESVLFVEDDASVRMLIRDVLQELGYFPIEAAEPETALPILASDQRIDLMISDVGLPGMNGRQLAEVARKHRPQLPILFITGYAENAAIRAGLPGLEHGDDHEALRDRQSGREDRRDDALAGALNKIANLYTSGGHDRSTIAGYMMNGRRDHSIPPSAKVPAVTLGFWVIKILATTLGETGGDTVTMTMKLGYLAGTAIFLSLLIVLVIFQIRARSFHPALYWATIVASTTAGTTMADFADRSLGIGYAGGSTLLLICVLVMLGLWYRSRAPYRSTPSTIRRRRSSIGQRSHSPRRSAPPSAIGWRMTRDSDTLAVRWSSRGPRGGRGAVLPDPDFARRSCSGWRSS